MGLFGWGKKHAAAEIVGHNLTAFIMDADDCWQDVCQLRSYKTTGPVATCEMAFARAALARAAMLDHRNSAIAERMAKASTACVVETFTDQDNGDTIAFYGGGMSSVGPSIVSLYEANVFPLSQWASQLGSRLGVPGVWSSEIAPMGERQRQRILEMLDKVKVV
jgi:hypothetical protein